MAGILVYALHDDEGNFIGEVPEDEDTELLSDSVQLEVMLDYAEQITRVAT